MKFDFVLGQVYMIDKVLANCYVENNKSIHVRGLYIHCHKDFLAHILLVYLSLIVFQYFP